MDKNTILGLLLMGLVIFGFMTINKNKLEEQQKQIQEQEQAEQRQKEAEEAKALAIEPITPQEADLLPAVMKVAGFTPGDSAEVFHYRTKYVDLTFDGKTVGGTVNGADTVLSYAAVANSEFGADVTPANRRAAIGNLRDVIKAADRYREFVPYLNGEEKSVTIKNDVIELEISNHGGQIARAKLLEYFNYLPKSGSNELDTTAVEICRPGTAGYSFVLSSASQNFDTSEFYFTPEEVTDSTVVMSLNLGGKAKWSLRYSLTPGSYVVKMDVLQKGMDKIIPPSMATTDFIWHQKLERNEQGRTFEERNSSIYYKFLGDSPDELGSQGDKSKTLEQRLRWIAFKNQFFSSVVIPSAPFTSALVESKDLKDDALFVKDYYTKATLEYSSEAENPLSFDFFIGPNLYPLLKNLDTNLQPDNDESLQLTKMIPLGWPIFRWINTLIIIPVFTFLSKFIASYGLIIFLLTLFIKMLLFPLTYKSYVSQAKMRVLAPEIKEINDKYPGQENAMTRNQKTMALYSSAGANPMSGCLPMMLQMPVLIAMFWFFPSAIELRGESFLWAKNLAAPDVILTLPFSIPWYGSHVSLFCLLMTVCNIVYTRINMQNQPSSQSMPGMKVMMYIMPLMFLFFFNDYASALSYYYLLSLLITIIQTYTVRYFLDEDKMRKKMLENAAKPKKKSGFMARLEEAQRKQQEILRQQQQAQRGGRNSKGRR